MKKQPNFFMKRLLPYFLSVFALASLIFVTSCGDDDETPAPDGPGISIGGEDGNEDPFEGAAGDTVNLTISIDAPLGFNRLQITKTVDNDAPVTISDTARTAGSTVNNVNIDFQYILQQNEVGKDVVLTFTATDDENNSTSEDYSIITTQRPAVRYSAVLLAAPLGDRTSETFFSSKTGETYTADEVVNSTQNLSAMIDFGYYYLPDAQTANLASPANYPESIYNLGPNGLNWSTLNNTKLKITGLSASQFTEFDESDVDDIFAAFDDAEFGANEERAQDIARFDVLAFEADAAQGENTRRGLILVEDMVAGDGVNGKIEIEVLVTQ